MWALYLRWKLGEKWRGKLVVWTLLPRQQLVWMEKIWCRFRCNASSRQPDLSLKVRNADETSDCLQIQVGLRKKSTSHSHKVAQRKKEQMMQYMNKDAFFICSSQENCFLRRFLLLNTIDSIARSQGKKTFRRKQWSMAQQESSWKYVLLFHSWDKVTGDCMQYKPRTYTIPK